MKLNDYNIEVTCDQPFIPKWRAWSNEYPVYGSAFGVSAGDAVAELIDLIERRNAEENERATNTACEVRIEKDGWIYFDQLGKDYGPYESREDAEARGPIAAKREEALIAKGCGWR